MYCLVFGTLYHIHWRTCHGMCENQFVSEFVQGCDNQIDFIGLCEYKVYDSASHKFHPSIGTIVLFEYAGL